MDERIRLDRIMREDMDKVIVERPRRDCDGGVKGAVGRLQRMPIEHWPRREGIKARTRGGTKYLNENLAPLRRFLHKSVGRPWNKVHQEMSQRIDRDNAVQAHIWQHVEDFICIHVMVQDGELFDERGWPLRNELYVDPRTGLVRRNKRTRTRCWWRQEPSKPAYRTVEMKNGALAVEVDGVWYEVELRSWRRSDADAREAVFRKPLSEVREEARLLYGGERFAVRKRQLNSKEVRRVVKPDRSRPLPNLV